MLLKGFLFIMLMLWFFGAWIVLWQIAKDVGDGE